MSRCQWGILRLHPLPVAASAQDVSPTLSGSPFRSRQAVARQLRAEKCKAGEGCTVGAEFAEDPGARGSRPAGV